jgi:anti-sigma B factor antagonist
MAESTVTATDDTVTVALSGEFDMAGTFTVEPALERVLQMPGLDLVTLDLSAVTFIDSVGLGVVIRFAREFQARAIALRIIPGRREVQRVFESTGMADALPFERGRAAQRPAGLLAGPGTSSTERGPAPSAVPHGIARLRSSLRGRLLPVDQG